MSGEYTEALLGSDVSAPATDRVAAPAASKRSIWQIIWRGPLEPRDPEVTLFWPAAQTLPIRLVRSKPRWVRKVALVAAWLICFAVNVLIAKQGILGVSCDYATKDSDTCTMVEPLGCGANSFIWAGPAERCGMNAVDCTDDKEEGDVMAFRCQSDCQRQGWVYQGWNVGAETAMRVPFVIGGPDVYRGDSFICVAALHAGIISRYTGGCGKLRWLGPRSNFSSTPSFDGRFQSLEFDAEFPLNFEFVRNDDERFTRCRDPRGWHVAINAAFIIMFAYFVTSPLLFLYTLVIIGFWTVILASNRPRLTGTPELNAELISLGFRRLLPCLLSTLFIYELATKPQLKNMRAFLSRTIFWGGFFIVGVLENFIFGFIPVDRLMPSDLNAQPGAWLSVFIIASAILAIAVGQAYLYWRKGVFRKYITAYVLGIGGLLLLACWPGLVLRIHHYILALALLPGTSLQTTPSLAYQGLLTGLYVAGVARWDFDSILQTSVQLSRGGSSERPLTDPRLIEPLESSADSFVIQWEGYPDHTFDGFSLVINDIERYRGVETWFNLTSWADNYYEDVELPSKWYVRVASANLGKRDEYRTGQFSKPMVVYGNGTYDFLYDLTNDLTIDLSNDIPFDLSV